ncbi:BCAS4 protein, partial [Amia calva]|nr:BCAS4 protein [Amia calva]
METHTEMDRSRVAVEQDWATEPETRTETPVGALEEECVFYLNGKSSKEVIAFQESVEHMLIRLDEFCGLLDMIRSDSTELLAQHIPKIIAKAAEMKNVYAKIDKIEAFVQMVGRSVTMLEVQVLEAEKEQRGFPHSLRKIIQSFHNPGAAQER